MSALHRKRAYLGGEIQAAETALNTQRDTLSTLDAVIRRCKPDSDPELIPASRPSSWRCMFFRHDEQRRVCLDALRDAKEPMSARNVAEYAMAAKGLDVEPRVRAKITEKVRQTLHGLAAKGIVRKLIGWPDTWWELANKSSEQFTLAALA